MSKTTTSLRAAFLAHNADWHRDGLYLEARRAAGSRAVTETLRAIADSIAKNKMAPTVDERVFLIQLLHAVARGADVAKMLRIGRPKSGHRKANPLTRDLTLMVDYLRAGGLGITAARKQTAAIVGMEQEAVRKAYAVGKLLEKDIHRRMREAEKAHAKAEKR